MSQGGPGLCPQPTSGQEVFLSLVVLNQRLVKHPSPGGDQPEGIVWLLKQGLSATMVVLDQLSVPEDLCRLKNDKSHA